MEVREPDRDPGWEDWFAETEKGNHTYEFEWNNTNLYCSYHYETANWGDGTEYYDDTVVCIDKVWVGDETKLVEITDLLEDLDDLDPIGAGLEVILSEEAQAARIEEEAFVHGRESKPD